MEPDRRRLLQMMAAALVADTTPAAGPVKWSTGTELPKLKAPAHACDCHHYLYDSRYPVDRRGIMFPGNASIADYRALQRRLGITRQVVVQPSAYGVDNRPVLAALAAFGREARGVVVVDDNISDAELRRMHEPEGVRDPLFGMVRRLIDRGRTWVKLVAPYDATKIGPPTYADSSALARAYVEIAPERVVWGTNWPHPGEDPKPDDALLFDLLLGWAPDEKVRHRILVQNPALLYDFPKGA